MSTIGDSQRALPNPHIKLLTYQPLEKQADKEEPAAAEPQKDEVSFGENLSNYATKAARQLGGTANVAIRQSKFVTSSVLQGFGVEESIADRIGSAASVASLGTTFPLAVMGSGVVGSLSVKGLGLEEKAQGEEASTFQKVKSAYITDVKEAEKEGQFVADQVISGAKNVAGKAQNQVTKVIDKSSELGSQALEGAESAVNSTIDFVKSLWG